MVAYLLFLLIPHPCYQDPVLTLIGGVDVETPAV